MTMYGSFIGQINHVYYSDESNNFHEGTDEISCEKYLFSGSSYSGSELDND